MQPEQLTHPATNPDGTCSDAKCPCHTWIEQEPQMTPPTTPSTVSDDSDYPTAARRNLLAAIERAQMIDRAIDATNEEIRLNGGRLPNEEELIGYLHPHRRAFDTAWANAPGSVRHGVEIEQAEYWFTMGRQRGRLDQIETVNEDLREIVRVARERVG